MSEIPDIPECLLRNAHNVAPFMATVAPVTVAVPEVDQDPFAQFKSALYDPEPDILREAKARRRNWMPSKTDPHQPSVRSFASRVRKEWKKEGRI
jgi:hypothetical protein